MEWKSGKKLFIWGVGKWVWISKDEKVFIDRFFLLLVTFPTRFRKFERVMKINLIFIQRDKIMRENFFRKEEDIVLDFDPIRGNYT